MMDPMDKRPGNSDSLPDLRNALPQQADAVVRKLSRIVEQAPMSILITDLDGCIEYTNPFFTTLTGYTTEEVCGQNPRLFKSGLTPDGVYQDMWQTLEAGRPWRGEFNNRKKNGEIFIELAVVAPVFGPDGLATHYVALKEDITHRRQEHEALESSLRDKEALLKEVHHRVKNNLQVVNSLLRLESGRASLPAIRSVLGDMQGRIRAMALLHETLYGSGTFATVDLGAYLTQLCTQAFRTQLIHPGAITLQLVLAPVMVGMDQAMPCGLLVNELISNCLKHGFPDGRDGEVRVELLALDGGTRLCLRVSDTGVGLGPDFEARRGSSLGLQLVSDLAEQLDGALEIGPGAVFAVTFTPDAPKSLAMAV